MTHIKGLLPTDSYHVAVRQVYHLIEEGAIRFVWTVDEDTEYAWRNKIEDFPLDEFGLARLERVCKALNFTMYPTGHPKFFDQFIGLRSKMTIGVRISGNVRENVVVEHNLPTQPPHFDVTKEKDNSHFFHTKNPRALPI